MEILGENHGCRKFGRIKFRGIVSQRWFDFVSGFSASVLFSSEVVGYVTSAIERSSMVQKWYT